jgi:hypothetical protein
MIKTRTTCSHVDHIQFRDIHRIVFINRRYSTAVRQVLLNTHVKTIEEVKHNHAYSSSIPHCD